jgi:hypothetical protein
MSSWPHWPSVSRPRTDLLPAAVHPLALSPATQAAAIAWSYLTPHTLALGTAFGADDKTQHQQTRTRNSPDHMARAGRRLRQTKRAGIPAGPRAMKPKSWDLEQNLSLEAEDIRVGMVGGDRRDAEGVGSDLVFELSLFVTELDLRVVLIEVVVQAHEDAAGLVVG